MEEALIARLLATSGLSALVGTRVWPIIRPQAAELPAVTVQLISPGRDYTQDGAMDLAGSRVQFDCWGANYASAKAVSREVISAVEPQATVGGIWFVKAFLDSARDMPVSDIAGGGKVFCVSLDLFLWWQPA